MSQLLENTSLFDTTLLSWLKDLGYDKYLIATKIISSLLLLFFLMFHANYIIKVEGESEKRILQKHIGITFNAVIIIGILSSYYLMVYTDDLIDTINYDRQITAENNILDAHREYIAHGVTIEYFNPDKTKHIYIPIKEDKELRALLDDKKNELHRKPLYLLIAFLLFISSFYFSDMLAKKTLQKRL